MHHSVYSLLKERLLLDIVYLPKEQSWDFN